MLSLLRKMTGGDDDEEVADKGGAIAPRAPIVPQLALEKLHAGQTNEQRAEDVDARDAAAAVEAAAAQDPEQQLVGGIHASLKVTGPGQPLMIDMVWPGGPAARTKMLSAGDLLLEVDGIDVTGKTVKEAQVCLNLKTGAACCHAFPSRQLTRPREPACCCCAVLQPRSLS
jgi:hypothetical protein